MSIASYTVKWKNRYRETTDNAVCHRYHHSIAFNWNGYPKHIENEKSEEEMI